MIAGLESLAGSVAALHSKSACFLPCLLSVVGLLHSVRPQGRQIAGEEVPPLFAVERVVVVPCPVLFIPKNLS